MRYLYITVCILAFVVFAGVVRADSIKHPQTILHPTCKIYLPIEEMYFGGTATNKVNFFFGDTDQDHWTHLESIFSAKGYTPEKRRVSRLPSVQEENFLLANIHHSYDLRTNFNNTRTCNVTLILFQLMDNGFEPFFNERAFQNAQGTSSPSSRSLLPGCDAAEQLLFDTIPACIISE